MTTLRAAAIQLTATADRARNLATADRLVRAAAADGARLIVLPEKWSVFGETETLRTGAEPLDGPALTWARQAARELGVDLIAGSIAQAPENGEPDRRNFNSCVHIGPDGTDRAVYRKVHLFDVEVGGRSYRESDSDRPGDALVTTTVEHDGAAIGIGLSICYDLRFPDLYARLAERGARILVVPAAFTEATTREHWLTLLKARAIENQCFVIAPNQIGEHSPGMRSGGRSAIVDPWGVVLATAADGETHITADLDLGRQDEIRARLPSLRGRRPEVYGR